MKLSELKKIIDELALANGEDLDVVLDIEPNGTGEYLVDIGEIYKSRMHEGKVKIEPKIELDTHKEPMRMNAVATMPSKIIDLRCPRCNKILGARDHFCKHCGQPLYTRDETHEYLSEEARSLRQKAKELKNKLRNRGDN